MTLHLLWRERMIQERGRQDGFYSVTLKRTHERLFVMKAQKLKGKDDKATS